MGQVPSHNTSNRSATLLRSKQDVRSVSTLIYVSFPIIDQGSIFDGMLGPPASNPVTRIIDVSIILENSNL